MCAPNALYNICNRYLILFGGRDNDDWVNHVPKTYDVTEVNGTLSFKTYDQKPLDPCADPNHLYYQAGSCQVN